MAMKSCVFISRPICARYIQLQKAPTIPSPTAISNPGTPFIWLPHCPREIDRSNRGQISVAPLGRAGRTALSSRPVFLLCLCVFAPLRESVFHVYPSRELTKSHHAKPQKRKEIPLSSVRYN